MAEIESSRIEELKKRLFQRDEPKINRGRAPFSPLHEETPSGWATHDETDMKKEYVTMPVLKKILFASIFFFVVVAGFATYTFFRGSNVISPDNIDIVVHGPSSTKGGEVLPLEIVVTNKNVAPLENVEFIVKYPPGTRSADDLNKEQLRYQRHVGTIGPGESLTETVKAVLFGAQESEQDIIASIEYRAPGSNAIFPKEKTYKLTMSSAPVSLSTKFPAEINNGQEVEFTVNLDSNVSNTLENMLLEVNYPSGFLFKSATPVPAFGNNVWDVGDLTPSSKRVITVRGVLEGQDEEVKAFRVAAGIRSPDDERTIGVPYSSTFETVNIRRPFVSLDVSTNGSDSAVNVVQAGEKIRLDIAWANNLSSRVSDGQVIVTIGGKNFDKSSVSAQKGFYRSIDNTITWTKQELSSLDQIEPGGTGRVSFNVASLGLSKLVDNGIVNPSIDFDITFRGKRLTPGGSSEYVETKAKRLVRVQSQVGIGARALHTTGPFNNTGPIPPRADQETTYTIVWSVASNLNTVNDSEVSAILPSYVKWLGVTSPTSEDVTFDANKGTVKWNVGQLKTSGGVREVSFQVALQTSLSQVGSTPSLLSETKFTGTDAFTKVPVAVSARELNTRLSTEPGFQDPWARVAP